MYILPYMYHFITPRFKMCLLLLMLMLCIVQTKGASTPFTAYIESCVLHVTWSSSVATCSTTIHNLINDSIVFTVSINNTRVNFPVDSASTFEAVSDGCNGNQKTLNGMATENISTIPELDKSPNVTVVNISDNTELNCTGSGAMKDFNTRWHRRGSENTLSNKTTLIFQNISYMDTGSYVCIIQYQSCDTDTTQIRKKNLTRTVHVHVQGAPLLILPDRRKSFHVAEGQPILFNITIASSPPPNQFLTIVKSNNRSPLQISVDFNRAVKMFYEEMDISRNMPLYTAYIRLTNITSSWTGEYMLYINNSHGYATYEFSIDVFRPKTVSVWQSNSLEIVGGSIGGFVFLVLVVGIVYMCHTRYKQKALQEKIKEFVEAEKKGSMESLEVLGLGERTKGFDNFTNEGEQDHHRQLQSLNTFNNPDDAN